VASHAAGGGGGAEPWLAEHGDLSRLFLAGASAGAPSRRGGHARGQARRASQGPPGRAPLLRRRGGHRRRGRSARQWRGGERGR